MRIAAAETPAPSTELAVINIGAIVPVEFFKEGGSDDILMQLETSVRAQAAKLDISTKAGREEIASLAYKVACSKKPLEDLRKGLTEDIRKQKEAIDAEGRKADQRIDALKVEVRKPLTDWENAEKQRVGDHEAALKLIQEAAVMPLGHSSDEVETRIAYVRQLHDRAWEEFKSCADLLTGQIVSALEKTFELAKQAEEQRAELARLRAAEMERQEAERIQRIRDEAAAEERRKAEAARIEQAEAAERERKRIEAEAAEAEARAKQAEAERIAAVERAQREAQELAERVERERVASEQRAAQALKEAEEQRIREAEYAEQKRIAAEKEAARVLEAERVAAEQRQQAAIEAERKRVADEAKRTAEEAARKAANREHQASINRKVLADLAMLNISDELGKLLIGAVAKGAVRHLTINY